MPANTKNMSVVNMARISGDVVVGRATYGPGGVCGPRVQGDHQLVILERGWMDAVLDGRMVHVAQGAAILLPPRGREELRFTTDGWTQHGWCAIRPAAVPALLRRELRAASRVPTPFPLRCAELFEGISAPPAPGAARTVGELGRQFAALGLLAQFAAAVRARAAASDRADEAMERAERFIHDEYARPLTLGDIARAAGVSIQHLLRIYRRAGAVTPTERLFARRLEVARELLTQTGLRVGEISDRCGFSNAFHFSRRFREAAGTSPRAFRAALWNVQGDSGDGVRGNPEPNRAGRREPSA